ncbi:hypothetical protein EDC48_102125 [Gibbsiella quercinecans]|nr:hypothetical protein EDC48_102125 [Gibbsiella quercinecans]
MDESPAGGFEGRKAVAWQAAKGAPQPWGTVYGSATPGTGWAGITPPTLTGGRHIDIDYKPRAYLRACSFSLPPRSAAISARLRSTPSGARLLLNAV